MCIGWCYVPQFVIPALVAGTHGATSSILEYAEPCVAGMNPAMTVPRQQKMVKKSNKSSELIAFEAAVGTAFLPPDKMRPGCMLKDSHKHLDELAIGQEFFEAMGLDDRNLIANLQDPPDLIFQFGDKKIGIENTLLVASDGEIDSKKAHLHKLAEKFRQKATATKKSELESEFDQTLGELRALEFWTKDYFLRRLRERILAKDVNPEMIETTPQYKENWLFVSVHGANLTNPYLTEYLEGQRFSSKLFSQIWVKLEYDPELKGHPIYELSLASDGVDSMEVV